MSEDRRHESARLGDYEVLDGSDTLNGAPVTIRSTAEWSSRIGGRPG